MMSNGIPLRAGKKSERKDVSKLQRRYEEIDRLIMPQAAKQAICSPTSARPFPDLGFRPRRDAAPNFGTPRPSAHVLSAATCTRAVFTPPIMTTGAKNQLLNINGSIRLIKVHRESTL